jgi:hypothetical protein
VPLFQVAIPEKERIMRIRKAQQTQ